MKFQFNIEYLPLLFFVLIIVFIVIGIIYSSAIKRNVFCAGPFVFLPTCDLSMLILPELNEPIGSICQSSKQCNGFRNGVKCCKGVCTITECNTCSQFCRVEERRDLNFEGKGPFRYNFRTCGRQEGQPCIFDTDCRGFGGPLNLLNGAARDKAICCGGICRNLSQLENGSAVFNLKSCVKTCELNSDFCFNYSCRL